MVRQPAERTGQFEHGLLELLLRHGRRIRRRTHHAATTTATSPRVIAWRERVTAAPRARYGPPGLVLSHRLEVGLGQLGGEAGLGELGGVRPVPCKPRAHVPASTRGWWRGNESRYASSSCTQNRWDLPCSTGRGNCEAGFERKRLTVLGEIPHRAAAAFMPMSRRSGSVPAPFVAVVCLRCDVASMIVNSSHSCP